MPSERPIRILRALPTPWRRRSAAHFSSGPFLAMALSSLHVAILATAILPVALAAVPPSQDLAPSPRYPAKGPEGPFFHRHPTEGWDSTSLDDVAMGQDPGHRQGAPGRGGQGLTEWYREIFGARSGSTDSIRLRAMTDDSSDEPERAAETVRGLGLPHTCGGVTFSKNETDYLVRSDDGAGNVDCGNDLDFQGSGIAGLGKGVFANMPTLQGL